MAKKLTIQGYQAFRLCRDYGFRDQICRAAVSIPSNVAEGVERITPAEFRNFLGMAKGSAGEVRSQLILAEEPGVHLSLRLPSALGAIRSRFPITGRPDPIRA
jgi:four helix bundle protein